MALWQAARAARAAGPRAPARAPARARAQAGLARGLKTTTAATSELARAMHEAGVERAYVAWRGGRVEASHDVVEPLRQMMERDTVDYDEHEAVFLQAYKDCVFGAFLWRTARGQGCGGIRLRPYESTEAFVRDGLRLAIGMGRKSALAGLWWGGGKGVIARGEDDDLVNDPASRVELLRAYGAFITSLRGAYVAAEDAGISVADMDHVFETTRYTTCISPSLGGSGNPSVPTALGVVAGMQGALAQLGMGTLEGKSVAVQGCGNVGGPMIRYLLERGVSRVTAVDIDAARIAALEQECADIADGRLSLSVDASTAILAHEADIVSPCAFGGVLNAETVPKIRAKIVCGAANNQLLDPTTDYGMQERGITYCPDFVVNRMGIVNCANEQYGRVGNPGGVEDSLVSRHLGTDFPSSIHNAVCAVIERASAENSTTNEVANAMANESAAELHPIHGHRTKDIVNQLILDGWAS